MRNSALAAGALAIYIAMTLLIAKTKLPWCDEGWYANAAYNLAFQGEMGMSVLEPSGTFLNAYLSGIQHRVYVTVPNHIVALAGLFRAAGFSLLAMRLYSILWGALGLLALFYILDRLFPESYVPAIAVLLVSIDFMFLWTAADGRAEAAANALAAGSLAAYLHFRPERPGLAIIASQTLLAAAIFTHPNALWVGLTVPVLALRDGFSGIKKKYFALAAVPYLLFAGLWARYILQDPSDFRIQFAANAASRDGTRATGILHPLRSVSAEMYRYFKWYSLSSMWGGEMNGALMLVVLLYLASLIWLVVKLRSFNAGGRTFAVCVFTVLIAFTFFEGFKAGMYLHYLVVWYDAVLAVWIADLWRRKAEARLLASAIVCIFAFLQIGTSVAHIRADEYRRQYLPAIADLEKERGAGKTIAGTAALGFGLGFHGFADDWRLGTYSGLQPDLLVLDRSYREFQEVFERSEPRVFAHAAATLTSAYHLSRCYGTYWIFERGNPGPIEFDEVDREPRGNRARKLFQLLHENFERKTQIRESRMAPDKGQ